MPFFETSELRLHYEQVPNLLPRPTLFLHGNLASNVWWEPSVEIWSRQAKSFSPGQSAYLAEWRGCGKSSGPASEADLAMPNLANDVVQLVKKLNVGPMHVVGHSTGGLIALLAMSQAPELFSRAVLLDPVSPKGVTLDPAILGAFDEMAKNRDLTATVLGGTIRGNQAASPLFQRIVDSACGVHPFIWKGIPKALNGIDFTREVSKVRHPTLVMHGQYDTVLPLDASQELAKLLPEGRFEMLRDQGHSCNVENPELFVQGVNRFLFG
ncbi:alpha/beta hydrolase [bacterium]|jgi:pimeloyl-ACP methyl ester carboxylesterase|nr:alpha/beta hydrolase [bacterium]